MTAERETTYASSIRVEATTSFATCAFGLDRASLRLRAAMAAKSASVALPASIRARA